MKTVFLLSILIFSSTIFAQQKTENDTNGGWYWTPGLRPVPGCGRSGGRDAETPAGP